MILIDDNTATDLDQLAVQHYERLIEPLNQNGRYHASQSLIGRIETQRDDDNAHPELRRVIFWNYLLNNQYANLKRIIVSRPEQLDVIINEIDQLVGLDLFHINLDYDNSQLTEFGIIVRDKFGYDNYRNSEYPAEYHDLFNLDYCPYCNKEEVQNVQTTNGVTGDDLTIRLYQLDHFYPKSRHPYFSVSFFNLIPGCSNCNARLKREKDFNINTHFNPFHKRVDDFFCFYVNNIRPKSSDELLVTYKNLQNHSDLAFLDFLISQRYNHRTSQNKIFNLIKFMSNHPYKIRRNLLLQFKNLVGSAESSKVEMLMCQGVPLTRNEINNQELGKLKRDICKQMGIL